MQLMIIIFFAAILAVIGLIFGSINEKRHYRSIQEREEQYKHILLFNEKYPPKTLSGQQFSLVVGSVVMANNRFKQIIAALQSIVGGRLTSCETMLDRGRREAILRMKEACAQKGAAMIFNVHFNTATLNNNFNREDKLSCTEILVYGTAWTPQQNNGNTFK